MIDWNLLIFGFSAFLLGWVLAGMFYIRRGNKELEDYIQSQKTLEKVTP